MFNEEVSIQEWWGQVEESAQKVANMYNLKVEKVARQNDETLYKFTGSAENIGKAMQAGYFYSTSSFLQHY